ncbi:hypothetical protein Taro_005874 [Colocasia esculenta]|uniref:Uncharacterized protein n=1 Tax=Colocasia esculenta TaxID=4460 RepID=A0A843TPI4_COLES|nr:hypothetical protein [Colocasia esculenta]
MASRGRRGVPARDGEQRRDEPWREDQGEQQAPAPQGPVLPPPPPVDYGVFMQGLVQTMQTQAHTQAALQTQLEAQASSDDLHQLVSTLNIRERLPTLVCCEDHQKIRRRRDLETLWHRLRRASPA